MELPRHDLRLGDRVAYSLNGSEPREFVFVRAIASGSVMSTPEGDFHGIRLVLRTIEDHEAQIKFRDFTTVTYADPDRPIAR